VGASGSGDQSNQILVHQVGNTRLKAETARIWTVGLVLQPRMVANLSVTVDFYDIRVDDAIIAPTIGSILSACYPGDSGTQNPADCAFIQRAPSGRILFVNAQNQNIGSTSTSGVDFAVRYALPTDYGRFGLGLDATYLKDYDQGGASAVGTYDLAFPLPKWKGNLGLNWRLGGLGVGTLIRYVGTFKECDGGVCSAGNPAGRQVGHNTTMDLNASYTLRSSFGRTLVMVGVNNVFDQTPQFVYSAPLANSDSTLYDFIGRYVYFRAQHTF
jgi:outer membrane receptor protein involved in Fe transport